MKRSNSIVTFLIALTVLFSAGFACNKAETSGSSTPTPGTPAANSTPAPSAPKNIAGEYDITGTNENGAGNYKGTLEIIERGEVYQFKWDTAGKKYDGVGVRTDNTVAAAFAEGDDGTGCGVILYKVNSDGSLDGKAGYWGKNSSESEKAKRNGSGLVGEYTLTGKNPDGKEYVGVLMIQPEATGYAFEWNVAGKKLQGFGIKQGDMMSVGIGGKKCGFVGYEIASDGTLNGRWGGYGSTSVGSETAKKK